MSVNRNLLANYLTGTQDPARRNHILNPSAFRNLDNINTSGGATVTRNTTAPLTAISDIQIGLSAVNQYVDIISSPADRAIRGGNCEVKFQYKASIASGETVKALLLQSAVTLGEVTLNNISTAQNVSINFVCSDSNDPYAVRIIKSSGTSAATINIANVYLGQATNLGYVSQAEFVGEVRYAAAANCVWSTTSGSYTDFATDPDCATPTVRGKAQAPTSKVPHATFLNLPAGHYRVVARASNFYITAGSGVQCSYRLFDSTNSVTISETNLYTPNAGDRYNMLVGEINLNNPLSSLEIKVQARVAAGSGSSCQIISDTSFSNQNGFVIALYRYPTSSEIAVSNAQETAYAEITFPAAANCIWSTTSGSYTDFAADPDCTTPSGSNLKGKALAPPTKVPHMIVENLPAGRYLVYAVDGHRYNEATSANPTGVCRIFDSTNNIEISESITYSVAGQVQRTHSALQGIVEYNSFQPSITYKIQCKIGGGSGAVIYDNRFTSSRIGLIPISQSAPAPILVGSITSSSENRAFRIESLSFRGTGSNNACTSSPCIVENSTSDWVTNVTRTSTGNYYLNFKSGFWKTPPHCVFTEIGNTAGSGAPKCWANIGGIRSTSSLFIYCVSNSTYVPDDTSVSVICMGERP